MEGTAGIGKPSGLTVPPCGIDSHYTVGRDLLVWMGVISCSVQSLMK